MRDEESETQRKAHAKRVRETRRSTQVGILVTEMGKFHIDSFGKSPTSYKIEKSNVMILNILGSDIGGFKVCRTIS